MVYLKTLLVLNDSKKAEVCSILQKCLPQILILISLQPDVVDLCYFKLLILLDEQVLV